MSTDAKTDTTADKPATDKPKKKRVRRVHRLGVDQVLSEYSVPDGGLESVPEDWSIGSHKELRATDFVDVLHYFQYVKNYATSLLEAADAKITELEQFGDADTRQAASELLGNAQSLVNEMLSKRSKGMSDDAQKQIEERMKEILGAAFAK